TRDLLESSKLAHPSRGSRNLRSRHRSTSTIHRLSESACPPTHYPTYYEIIISSLSCAANEASCSTASNSSLYQSPNPRAKSSDSSRRNHTGRNYLSYRQNRHPSSP